MFSDIVQRFETTLNALYQERDARRARGQKVLDLVSGNVNRAGFVFPSAVLQQALRAGLRRSEIYQPDPLGQKPAREAIARYYKTAGVSIPAKHIVLTPGTSLSYLYVFKILANPGDEILCPRPSYPLLDSIAELCGIHLTSYRLLERDRWTIDFADLESRITPRTRAILLISPHNPTGAVATPQEIAQLCKVAKAKSLPILSDEVFSEFLFHDAPFARPASSADSPPLVFTLNGISKMFALPGMKLGWIGVSGDPRCVSQAVHALDLISDTFLPVNEAVQAALPLVFSRGKNILKKIQKELHSRLQYCTEALQKMPGVSGVTPEGGFYLTVRLTAGQEDDRIALQLLKTRGVLVHPGYFYDLEGSHLVFSFATPWSLLRQALPALQAALRSM